MHKWKLLIRIDSHSRHSLARQHRVECDLDQAGFKIVFVGETQGSRFTYAVSHASKRAMMMFLLAASTPEVTYRVSDA
jgi:hypothetical protein